MKSLGQITSDNRITNRDFGGLCNWAVFHEGDFVALFVHEEDAREFASLYEYTHGSEIIVRWWTQP